MVTVLNYGMGNLRSVQRAFEAVGTPVQVTDNPSLVAKAERIVLPGVGAFGAAVERIRGLGLWDVIIEKASRGVPTLGICLGMQLMFETSEESPGVRGLGLVPGSIKRFAGTVKVPHIGWNEVSATRGNTTLTRSVDGSCFYFVHSYFLPVTEETTGTTAYAGTFSSVVERGNIFGVQFHPEKSQGVGQQLLSNFLKI
jgi:glutamine amidotransferase